MDPVTQGETPVADAWMQFHSFVQAASEDSDAAIKHYDKKLNPRVAAQ
mgnify:CR=1 FL=1